MAIAAGKPGEHDFIENQDLDGNGIPDQIDNERRSNDGGLYGESRDYNRNHIPDHFEGVADNDAYSVEYGPDVHRNDPLDRTSREVSALVGATYETDGGADDIGRRTDRANAEAAKHVQENEANPNKTEFGRDAISTRISKLRKKRLPKTSLAKELSRIPNQKEDTDTGIAVAKKFFQGMFAGMRANKEEDERRKALEIDGEIEGLKLEQREMDEADRARAKAEGEARAAGDNKAADQNTPGDEGPAQGGSENGPEGQGPEGGAGPEGQGPDGSPQPNSPEGPVNSGPEAAVVEPANDAPAMIDQAPANQNEITPLTAANEADRQMVPAEQERGSNDAPAPDTSEKARPSANASPAEATGHAGLGLAAAAVNPAAAIAVTSVQTEQTQKDAGASHVRPEKAPAKAQSNSGKGGARSKGSDKPAKAGKADRTAAPRARTYAATPTSPNPQAAKPAAPIQNTRQGRLFDQARGVPRSTTPMAPIQALGPRNPEIRVRALGLGSGIGSFISAARAIAPRDQNYELGVRFMQDLRDKGGLER